MTPGHHPSNSISVVIPTLNRAPLLERLLASLDPAIDRVGGPVEVIVVDDSNANHRAQVEAACVRHGATYIYEPTDLSSKRNIGIQQSRYPIVLLIDDDCIADADLLVQHLRVYREDAMHKVGGCVGLTQFYGDKTWLWEVLEQDTPFTIPFDFAASMDEVPWGTTNNMSLSRAVLDQLGGFRTTLRKGQGGEDVDLSLRVWEAGWTLKAAPLARVMHTRETWNRLGPTMSRIMHYGRADAHLVRMHVSRTVLDMPRLTVIALLAAVTAAASALVTARIWPLVCWAIWIALTLALNGVLLMRWRGRTGAFWRVLVGDLLCRIFEVGVVYESLIRWNWAGLTRRMVYTSGQQTGDWYQSSLRLWAALLAATVVIVLVAAWHALGATI